MSIQQDYASQLQDIHSQPALSPLVATGKPLIDTSQLSTPDSLNRQPTASKTKAGAQKRF